MNESENNLSAFITGATGYIGGAVVGVLLSHNWRVTALVRNKEAAKYLEDKGVNLIQGSLEDLTLLSKEALGHNLIVHAARSNDDWNKANELEFNSTITLLEAAKSNSSKQRTTFIFTSGTLVLGSGDEEKDEFSAVNSLPMVQFRVELEKTINNYNDPTNNLFTAVIRPVWVYGGNLSHISNYLKFVAKENYVPRINKGLGHYNFVHIKDLAMLYYLVYVKKGHGIYHGSDGVHVSGIEFDDAISKSLNCEIKDIEMELGMKLYGFFAFGQTFVQKINSTRSFGELGWKLEYPSFISTLDKILNELNIN